MTKRHLDGVCRHLSKPKPLEDRCAVGRDIDALAGDAPGSLYRKPCQIRRVGTREGFTPFECEQYEPYTEEEIQEDERSTAECVAKTLLSVPLIADAKMRGGVQVYKCPACECGDLTIAVAASNGHTRGSCSTEDCLRWMG